MAGKPNSRNWNDVQMVIVASALALTLSFWNLFAGPDRVRAIENQNTEQAAQTGEIPADTAQVAITPSLEPVKIMLGGVAPGSQSAFVPGAKPKPRGGGGGGGGGTGGS